MTHGVARSRRQDWPQATAAGGARGLDDGEHDAMLAAGRGSYRTPKHSCSCRFRSVRRDCFVVPLLAMT
jgi:hypothetical protein